MKPPYQTPEWFPRHHRGTCFGAGPGNGSDLADRLISRNLQRNWDRKWEAALDLFQRYASALSKWIGDTDAERKANSEFRDLCFARYRQYNRGEVWLIAKAHLPNTNDPQYVRILQFVETAEGKRNGLAICQHCLQLIRWKSKEEHERKCIPKSQADKGKPQT